MQTSATGLVVRGASPSPFLPRGLASGQILQVAVGKAGNETPLFPLGASKTVHPTAGPDPACQ